jgi:Tfp pilus assembly protein PilF
MDGENMNGAVSQAWRYQRDGQATNAIAEFERILKQDANHVDANYGMGLAQRAAGHPQEARQYFKRALELVEASEVGDRSLMLGRMLKQRLAETGSGS